MIIRKTLVSTFLDGCKSIPRMVPIDIMTGLPVQPPIVADSLRIKCQGQSNTIREKPLFITNFFRRMNNIPLLTKDELPLITPYRPHLYRLKDLEQYEMHEILYKYPPYYGSIGQVSVFVQRKWRPVSGTILKNLRGGGDLWIEEREVMRLGYNLPPYALGIHIPSPYACYWYHVDQTLFESMFGYEYVVQRSFLNEEFLTRTSSLERKVYLFSDEKLRAILHGQTKNNDYIVAHENNRSYYLAQDHSESASNSILTDDSRSNQLEKLKRFSIPCDSESYSTWQVFWQTPIRGKAKARYPDADLCQTFGPTDENVAWWLEKYSTYY